MADEQSHQDILGALHRLELSFVQRFADHAASLRDRMDTAQRQHAVELQEFKLEVYQKFAEFSQMLNEKTDGARAKNYGQTMWFIVGLGANLLMMMVNIFWKKLGGV